MKIKSAKLYSFPVRGGTEWIILKISSDSNFDGFSELTMSNYSLKNSLQNSLSSLLKKIQSEDLKNDDQINELLSNSDENYDLAAATSRSGIRSACSDIFAKENSKPMHEYLKSRYSLPGTPSNFVNLYANINRSLLPDDNGPADRSPKSFSKMAKKALDDGFSYIKCAPFDGYPNNYYKEGRFIQEGLARVKEIAKLLDRDKKLLVDCHSKFDQQSAISTEKKLFKLGVNWFEEPMNPKTSYKELKEIKKRISGYLVGGEEFYGVKKFLELLKSETLDILMPDIKYCGGIEEAIKIGINLAKISKGSFSIHCPSGPISLLGSAHVTAALNSELPLEHAVYEITDRSNHLNPNEKIMKGKIFFPRGHGLGAEPNFNNNHKIIMEVDL
ncbi:MAG: enolase C-terminal domain-like protein [Chloroflexota bacterium]|nr:enolase C-terminal domain-like protein [Chloroflexota bacterium]|tara:strand:+ start:600 stop:1760 length:1161 start_codon:yes stop_codon:yes gene_type:complete